jgi:retron-type reverse transcriptase
MANCQEWILANILNRVPPHAAAHGFVAGRSTVTNAAPHVGRAVVLNTDLTDFFPTVTFPRVKGIFEGLGYSPAAATILALVCTDSPRRAVEYEGQLSYAAVGPRSLPQGACTSPALSNLVARNLDARLAGIGAKLGWTYTRYADDLTFSADAEAGKNVGYLLARIRHISQDEGFAVNEKKTRVQRRNTAQSVTGIVVNDRPGVPRKLRRRLRAILHHAKFEGLERQNRENHPYFEGWLRGMLAYAQMVNPEQAARLRSRM